MRAAHALLIALGLGWSASAVAEGIWQLPVGTSPQSLHMRASAWRLATSSGESDKARDEPGSVFSLPTGKGLDIASGALDRLAGRQHL